jgi:hypothetical protein
MQSLSSEEVLDEYKALFRRMKIAGLAEPYVLYNYEFEKLVEAMEEAGLRRTDDPFYSFRPCTIKVFGYEVERYVG